MKLPMPCRRFQPTRRLINRENVEFHVQAQHRNFQPRLELGTIFQKITFSYVMFPHPFPVSAFAPFFVAFFSLPFNGVKEKV